jgi:hypothetical protein
MSPTLKALLALALALPFTPAALAQPTANPATAAPILNSPPIRAGAATLRDTAALRLTLLRRLGFQDGSACFAPVPISGADIDIHRSLFVHDAATLNAGNFSLRRTLTKIKDDVVASVPAATAESIFRQLMDTQNDTPNAATAGNALCSDSNGKVNGFPFNKCPRPEGIEATGADSDIANRIDNDYKPVALVNRIDLADKGWKNCGEHRIVYGKNVSGQKNLIIFEAVLPNPKPGCRSGCRDVIDFWADLSADTSPTSRAAKLENFFYGGLPGFQAVVRSSHYTSGASSVYGGSGSGQIRTNQFLFRTGMGQGPWTLKEFKTFLSCAGGACDFDILPTSVKVNPYGVLWNRNVATGTVPALPPENSYATAIGGLAGLASSFQAEVAAQVTPARLANPDINSVTYEVTPGKNSAESQSQSPTIDDYPTQFASALDATFRTQLDALATPFLLTGAQIVNRATANSCAGCHLPNGMGLTNANSIGPGMSWPAALSFVHVDTLPTVSLTGQPEFNAANFGGNANGFNISPALLNAFLPARENNLVNVANLPVCDCVPKPNLLSTIRANIPRQVQLIDDFGQRVKSELAGIDKRFIAQPTTKESDRRELLQQKKAAIARLEATRNKELQGIGLTADPVTVKIEPVRLDATRASGERLKAIKLEKLREIVNAEPPRESITGSFRPH